MTTLLRRTPGPAVAWWGFGVAAFYAIAVRFYQAAGGEIGMAGEMLPEHAAGAGMASYLAGLLILLGGVACLYLGLPEVRRIPRWFPVGGGREIPGVLLRPLCLTPVLVGAVFAVAHAFVGTTTKAAALLGVMEIPYPDVWAWIDEDATAWWDLAFYEPCFLLLGVFLHLSAVRYLRATGREAVARWTTVVSAVCAVGFAAVGIWMVASDKVLVL
ncbi:hypothetical protein [Phytomonospora endophytica]|uniref:DUF3995 domain-containing protein n=1 Tax=Phytomonospora endophytica TaxID=714109 RepID=A0A841FWC1_9ACTN|nr:hypothetical protein [Phytomonospora endophytica]MBB6039053.1 hypothetical protein [Phytomonospora endophytica]GIG71482.1 hypothetical protein Pen01_77770 [Phytomonospora endophytica]